MAKELNEIFEVIKDLRAKAQVCDDALEAKAAPDGKISESIRARLKAKASTYRHAADLVEGAWERELTVSRT